MTRTLSMVGFSVVAFVLGASCTDGNQTISPGPKATQSPPDTAATNVSEPSAPDASKSDPEAAGNCRWQGYGIGPLGAGQCLTEHLLAHAAESCGAGGGVPMTARDLTDQCPDGQADEVQALCCFAGGVPAAADTPVGAIDALNERLSQTDPPASRSAFIAKAADTCAARALPLGDWSLLYQHDGTTPDLLRFECR